MAKTVSINSINPITFEYQDYSPQDGNLIVNFEVETKFNPLNNYISYFVYDIDQQLVYSQESGFRGYRTYYENLTLDPESDIEDAGFDIGEYNTVYLFLNNEVSSSINQRLYIEQISSDRTELRLNTTQISNLDLITGASDLINRINLNPAVYFDFYLNFGDNQLVIANNILLDTTNPNDPTILIKLYEPLPIEFDTKTECWVVTQVADPVAYNIVINQTFTLEDENIYLKGPNVNLGIKDQINNSTEYVNYSVLTTSSYATGSGSLQYQINSILAERGIEINVDYSNYSNFIYFSSALTRLENFYYKLQLIEEYTYSASLSSGTGINAYVTESRNVWQSKINEIITTFDGYDYFLYYESGSGAWPKTNSTYPYINTSTTSVAGQAFLTTQSISASAYDANNNNGLINAIPSYLREDSANAQYELFIEMLGEMFDNIWIYYQDVTEKWNADNRLNYGVSKDLVADILRDLGLKIYQNSFSSTDLYAGLLGVTPAGNQFPFPFITSSLPTPSGYEYVNTLISASSEVVPLQDVEYSTYKRIYHNLPLLLKKKGTTVGLQNLITTFGVPDTILRVAEFGGKDRDNSNDWDYWQHKYNKAFDTSGSYYVSSSFQLNTAWAAPSNRPATVEFRFKTRGLPFNTASIASQSLWSTDGGVSAVLRYTGSGYTSGSYSGSTVDPYYQYAKLDFYPNVATPNTSASVYLPFYDGGWWSVMITSGSGTFTLYAGNNLYNGDDGSTIGFIASSSIADTSGQWPSSTVSYLGSGSLGKLFSGSLQELRYYTIALNSSSFEEFVVNSDSIDDNGVNTTPNTLAFRASLGGELHTASVSIHPKVTGSWVATSSFASNSNFWISASRYTNNDEYIFLSQPAAGIQNIVSNKIQVTNTIIAPGNTVNTGSLGTNVLSQYRSIQQQSPLSASYTKNLAYTEVAFSPQNEINDDIMNSLGFFNMGEYIGDPRQRFSEAESYPDLDALRNAYFEKYKNNYDINDYIRLIKYFDNSLFKMVKDFTPARSSLASGVVIKQNLLERNKYPQPEVNISSSIAYTPVNTPLVFEDITITGSIGSTKGLLNGQTIYTGSSDFESIPLETVSGSQGGAFATLETPISGSSLRPVTSSTGQRYTAEYGTPIDPGLILTQSFLGFNVTPSGSVAFTQSNAQEFFNGELSGSNLVVENGELNEWNLFKNPSTTPITYNFKQYTLNDDGLSVSTGENAFLALIPSSGEALVYNYYGGPGTPIPTYGNKWLIMHKTSANGVDVTSTLQEITSIKLGTLVSGTKNFNIISISEKPNYFIFLLAPPDGVNSFVNNQGEQVSNVLTVLNPFDSYAFYNSAANPLLNNAQEARAAEYFYDLDYSTGTIVPTNYLSVISASQQGGFDVPAQVQEYNWRLRRSIIPRYSGSKLFATNYNTWSLGDQSFGKDPVIDYYGNIAFDVDFVGGTYPELQNGTAVNIIKANIFNSPRESVVIDQNNPSVFNFVVNQYLGYSQSAEIFSNDVSPIKDNNVRFLDGTIGFPANSTYFIPRQQTFGDNYGGIFYTASLGGIIFCSARYNIFPQVVDADNRYATSSVPAPRGAYSVFSASLNISKSIEAGNDWYITLYSGSSYPLPTYNEAYASGGLDPYNSGSNANYIDAFSLQAQGVYKITSFASTFSPAGIATDGNAYFMTTVPNLPDNAKGFGSGSKSNNNTGLSALIWQSNPFPQPVLPVNRPDYFPAGIGQKGGYVIPDDFNNNLKASIFALQTVGVPVVTSNGIANQVVNQIPSNNPTGNQNTTPFGVAGTYDGETRPFRLASGLTVTYTWDSNVGRWVTRPGGRIR